MTTPHLYTETQPAGGVPIKMWTRGVPVEASALRQLTSPSSCAASAMFDSGQCSRIPDAPAFRSRQTEPPLTPICASLAATKPLAPRTKSGPALAGYGAIAMADALKRTVSTQPAQRWQSLNSVRDAELSDHTRFTIESGVKAFFAEPHCPWQRGTNQNRNGLLRLYGPKGIDLSRWSTHEIDAVAQPLNNRPRKTLVWQAQAEALNDPLKYAAEPGIAPTDRIRPGSQCDPHSDC